MTARPSGLSRALIGFALAAALPLCGCAGTDAGAAGSSSRSSSSASPGSSGVTDGSQSEATGQRIEVEVADGQVTGDTGRLTVPAGEHVTLVVTSDVADEVHLHGYDLEGRLTPGAPTTLTFDATVPGVFEVELHEAGTLLLSLQVG